MAPKSGLDYKLVGLGIKQAMKGSVGGAGGRGGAGGAGLSSGIRPAKRVDGGGPSAPTSTSYNRKRPGASGGSRRGGRSGSSGGYAAGAAAYNATAASSEEEEVVVDESRSTQNQQQDGVRATRAQRMRAEPFEMFYDEDVYIGHGSWVEFDNPNRGGKKCQVEFKKDHVTIALALKSGNGSLVEFSLELDQCNKIQVRKNLQEPTLYQS